MWQSSNVSGLRRPVRWRWLDGRRRPTRRDGWMATALFVVPWTLLVMLPGHRLDTVTVFAIITVVATASVGLPTVWLSWANLRAAKADGPDLAQIADELASRLGAQWAAEAEAQGLNDPYPLPVAWTAAGPALADGLEVLRTLATTGSGWSVRGRENWAESPEDLAGGGARKLADTLAAVPAGRLVVLGAPGSGKTVLMVGLVLDLLNPDRRSSGGPVPVLATLASWDPSGQGLHDWLGATLMTGYPDLGAEAPAGSAGGNRFEALLEARLILPVLDGLDEIPESARPEAIARINRELKPGEQVVVTCRTQDYRAAIRAGSGIRAAAVQLSPLEFGDVTSYLREDAGPARGRWDFLDTLGTGSPARQVLATPLMAGLARAYYNPRPGEHAGKLRDPAELRDFADRAKLEAHLLDTFIPAAYRPSAGGRWTASQAETWLAFLARHLEKSIRGPDLAWWQLRQTASRSAFMRSIVLDGTRHKSLPSHRMQINVRGLRSAFFWAVVAGLVVGIAVATGTGPTTGPGHGLAAGLGFGIWIGLMAGLAAGLTEVPGNLAGVTSPAVVLARDRKVAILLIIAVELTMLGVLLVAGFDIGFSATLRPWSGTALVVIAGLMTGFAVSAMRTDWPDYMLTRGWLTFHHHLPWPLMSFLADAHKRGVLRQAGAVYQFRHIELQHRLATRDQTP